MAQTPRSPREIITDAESMVDRLASADTECAVGGLLDLVAEARSTILELIELRDKETQ